MLNDSIGSNSKSLISEYSALLGDAILRHRTRIAERAARIEAELASKIKSEFIANMSHELRTPLNSIIGFSKLLSEHERRPVQDGEIVQYAKLIKDAAGHLLAVINDILDISKIQSGRYTLASRELALDEILEATVASFSLMAKDAGVILESTIARDMPPIWGDPVKLRQIFTNLISNAVKFSRSGGVVAVEATVGNGTLGVIVRDSGIGMNPEEIRIALTPFGQVDSGRTRWREGTGLGLPIAKALVELHGGRLEIRSRKGVGTEVTIVLPARCEVAVADRRAASACGPAPHAC